MAENMLREEKEDTKGRDVIEEYVSDATGQFSGAVYTDSNVVRIQYTGEGGLDAPQTGEVLGRMAYDLFDGRESIRADMPEGSYEIMGDEGAAAAEIGEDEYFIAHMKRGEQENIQRPDVLHMNVDNLSKDEFGDRANNPVQEAWERARDDRLKSPRAEEETDFEVTSFRDFPSTVGVYMPARKAGRAFGRAENSLKKLTDRFLD